MVTQKHSKLLYGKNSHSCSAHTCKRKEEVTYLHDFVQNLLLSLIFAIAEETVSVDIVGITIQFDIHVVGSLEIILDCKCDLC